ncbi:MAG: sugar transferase [Agathobacter sp.]|nr:sugar transferase [Agathobacter sp.]
MKALGHSVAIRVVKIMNIVMVTIPFLLCWYLYYASRISSPYYAKGNWLIIALFMILYSAFAHIYDGFLISLNRVSEMIYSQILAFLITDGIMYIVIWLLSKQLPNVVPGLLAIAGQCLQAALWSGGAHRWYFATFEPQKCAIIYDNREGMEKLIEEYDLTNKFHVEYVVPVERCMEKLYRVKDMECVFLSGIHSHERNIILKECMYHGVRVYVIPRVGDMIMSSAKKMHMFHLPMLQVERFNPIPEYLFVKRFFDIVISLAALVLLSPFMLVTAIAIKLYDHGPVLYKQNRLTKDGRVFQVLKFRSMRVDAEKDGVARLSTGDKDDRITPVGHVIRKIRFDELPQLFNILRGDMSIVGPRPERPEIAAEYEKELPEFALRLQVKAGLTGYAQVYGKYNTTPYDKLQMDLMYIATASFVEDLKICFATVKILFMPESTEGVAEGQKNAMDAKNSGNGEVPGENEDVVA